MGQLKSTNSGVLSSSRADPAPCVAALVYLRWHFLGDTEFMDQLCKLLTLSPIRFMGPGEKELLD